MKPTTKQLQTIIEEQEAQIEALKKENLRLSDKMHEFAKRLSVHCDVDLAKFWEEEVETI